MVNLIALQMVSGPDPETNLEHVSQQLAQLRPQPPALVVLPECFACFGASDRTQLEHAEPLGDGPIQHRLQQLAKEYGIWLVAGTMPIQSEDDSHFYATSLLFNPNGERVAAYRKIHLFDVEVEDSTRSYQESRYTHPGDEVVVVETEIGRIGLSVCYDVRFPGLFQAMGEIDILVLPAAFTKVTGEAHWESLIRARAIEKQCYLVAPGQGGVHDNGRETYGHSMIVSPWGDVLKSLSEGEGSVFTSVDTKNIDKLRAKMPVGKHNRFRSQLIEAS
ncbi:Nitrilase [Saliniradius amylolyticus]|uniref:Nitrilase n=1 Tax=Saliniradius amylolyticus TaxID=2183582 RepID=A0A2S2DZI3_9ALTE|nr:carbon-nitrogen hydrolase family protein [Saliniradius amylolyticus]AWL10801.1 Nitrilase [Saliniradius amylolyticus]